MSKHFKITALLALLIALPLPGIAAPPARERIGTSAGAPVYRDQLTGASDAERSDSAQNLLIAPALREYFQQHRAELEPSEAEVAEVVAALEAARACEPAYMKKHPMTSETRAFVARMLLAGRGVLRHVHGRFGGGRLLFQQAGVEAFDATRRLVEHLESQERVTFEDASVRALAYDYWTRDHGAWLITDEADIRRALDDPVVAACPAAPRADGTK